MRTHPCYSAFVCTSIINTQLILWKFLQQPVPPVQNLFIFYSDLHTCNDSWLYPAQLSIHSLTNRQTDKVKTAPAALEWTEMIRTVKVFLGSEVAHFLLPAPLILVPLLQ